jgi:3',5'-nucleoside bisphosphate phosphatase
LQKEDILNWKELVSSFRITKHSETFSSNNIKKNKVDLHIHTTASDGYYSPQEVIKKATAAELNIISITDHDTVDAIDEAKYYADKVGIEIITGIELSAES